MTCPVVCRISVRLCAMTEFTPDTVFYAIGDVHGMARALSHLHARILDHHQKTFSNRPAAIIHLGDYVDRGPESRQVIDVIMALEEAAQSNPRLTIVSLRGNHEEMMIGGLGGDPAFLDNWVRNGGGNTLESYVEGDQDQDQVMLNFPRQHADWLKKLPTMITSPQHKFVFVHAGIDPLDFPDCRPQVHLWTRSPRFFRVEHWTSNPALAGVSVVHGHSPTLDHQVEVEIYGTRRRINVDTGAVFGGPLTAVVLDGAAEPVFIQVDTETARVA